MAIGQHLIFIKFDAKVALSDLPRGRGVEQLPVQFGKDWLRPISSSP
jgi:hypothetical protein